MADKHLSSQFDTDLNALCSSLLEMGGMVEVQIIDAMRAFSEMNIELCKEVVDREKAINTKEIEIDLACAEIIARRQPTARDLRLVMAVSKAITNLERAGDEVEKIAKRTRRIIRSGAEHKINVAEIIISGQLAVKQLRQSLDAFARLDREAAVDIVLDDRQIDEEFRAFVRKLTSYMTEDPQTIATGLDMLTIAKSIERIGDHAKNIAEFVIYVVGGEDVRHSPKSELQKRASEE
ncbi:MAG: phosphate signaling complex protein PhoU [Burkholderiaceae bacterium]|jgi:phosphate transport system protein|nr:phosphate signaling complex protein PhoU [Burkholderiaceae bacterium]